MNKLGRLIGSLIRDDYEDEEEEQDEDQESVYIEDLDVFDGSEADIVQESIELAEMSRAAMGVVSGVPTQLYLFKTLNKGSASYKVECSATAMVDEEEFVTGKTNHGTEVSYDDYTTAKYVFERLMDKHGLEEVNLGVTEGHRGY